MNVHTEPANFNRRQAFTFAGAAALAGGATAVAAQDTPIMRLYRVWKRRLKAMNDINARPSDEELSLACSDLSDMEVRIMDMPAQGPKDWLIKVAVWTTFGESGFADRPEQNRFWDEAQMYLEAA